VWGEAEPEGAPRLIAQMNDPTSMASENVSSARCSITPTPNDSRAFGAHARETTR
jgi:hypothetical protein